MNHEEEISQRELKEETVFNMVNAMLLRIHQSGHLAKLDEMRFGLKCGEKRYLAVWRRCGQKETMDLPIPELKGVDVTVDQNLSILCTGSICMEPQSGKSYGTAAGRIYNKIV